MTWFICMNSMILTKSASYIPGIIKPWSVNYGILRKSLQVPDPKNEIVWQIFISFARILCKYILIIFLCFYLLFMLLFHSFGNTDKNEDDDSTQNGSCKIEPPNRMKDL